MPRWSNVRPALDEMLETLLGMDEGPALDFKQEQYPFEKETAAVKSELLKDILCGGRRTICCTVSPEWDHRCR